MTLSDAMRAATPCADDSHAGLLAAGAWRLDQMTTRVATLTGTTEATVRVSEGLNVGPDGSASSGRAVGGDGT